MNFRENFKKDMKKCDHHIADLRKQLASRYAAVEKVRVQVAEWGGHAGGSSAWGPAGGLRVPWQGRLSPLQPDLGVGVSMRIPSPGQRLSVCFPQCSDSQLGWERLHLPWGCRGLPSGM